MDELESSGAAPASPRASGPVTIEDVRATLAEAGLEAGATNAGVVRRLLGSRGSLSTIQRHLDALRAESAAPALDLAGQPPDAPREVAQAIWSAAWLAAQARTAGALAQSQQQAAQLVEALALARADLAAAHQTVAEADSALEQMRSDQARDCAMYESARGTDRAEFQGKIEDQAREIESLRERLDALAHERDMQRVQHEAATAALRAEVDRLVSQLADLRNMRELLRRPEAPPESPEPAPAPTAGASAAENRRRPGF